MRYGAFGLVEVVGSSNFYHRNRPDAENSRDVSFLTRNGKCGGHETVFVTGDVSAVTAAVQAVKENLRVMSASAAVISILLKKTVRLVEEDAQKHGFMKKTNTKK